MADMGAPRVTAQQALVPGESTANASKTVIYARVQDAGTVTAVTYTPAADVAGHASNNRTLSLVNKGQAGTGSTTIATVTTNTSNSLTGFDEKALTLSATAANLEVAAGDILAWISTHNASGVADPGGIVYFAVDSTPAGHTAAGYLDGM